MRLAKKLTAAAAFFTVCAVTVTTIYAADNAFQIDELNWTQDDWNSIAMTNDDTVKTGAVIRTEASEDSDAAGYLYRGAAARVIDKGDEWTLVESGKVTGYIKNEFLMYGDDARGLAAHYGEQGITANWDDVSVYSENSADSAVSQTIDSGTALGMIEDGGHWITVQKDKDTAGYVSEEDVSRVLLVDTAVPAEGDDIEDVAVTMTAEDVSEDVYAETAGEYSDDSGLQEAEYTADDIYTQSDEAYDGTDSYADTSVYDGSYADTSTYDDAYADTSADDSSYSDISYTEYAQTEETQQPADITYAAAEDTADDSVNTYTAEKVSDDAQIQALYEAYIEAQNAAMNCTSEEDAEAKAADATAAWNAYLAACSGTSYTSSEDTSSATASVESPEDSSSDASVQEDSSYTVSDTSEEDDAGDTASENAAAEESAATAADTAASSENTGSYAGYSDLDLLAAIIWCEAGNQPYDGMVAVGQVVMNRVNSSSFPNTIAEVLNQPGQFTPASSGTLQAALAAGVNSTCYSAASDALNGAAPVPGTPLYFNTHSGSYKLGDHYFS